MHTISVVCICRGQSVTSVEATIIHGHGVFQDFKLDSLTVSTVRLARSGSTRLAGNLGRITRKETGRVVRY